MTAEEVVPFPLAHAPHEAATTLFYLFIYLFLPNLPLAIERTPAIGRPTWQSRDGIGPPTCME